MLKKCVVCGDEFSLHTRSNSAKTCKPHCERKNQRRREKEYRDRNKPQIKLRHRAYYDANKDKITVQVKKYHQANPNVWNRSTANYRRRHPDRVAVQEVRNEANKKSRRFWFNIQTTIATLSGA